MTVLSSHSWEQHSTYVGSTICEVEASWKCSRTWWTSPRPGRWKSKRWETETIAYLFSFFFSKFNSERLHPSSAHDDSQDDLQLISTYEYRRSLYRSYILRISCHCMFQIYSSSSQRFCWWIAQEELTKLRSKETEAKHSYEMLTQSLQDWSSQRIKGLFGSQCSMQHWCEPILVFLLWICRMICPHI